MLIWTLSIVVTAILILTLGWLLSLELDEHGSNDWSRRLVTSVGLGVTFLVLISYVLIATVGFSGIASITALALVIGLLILRRILVKVVYNAWNTKS